MGARDMQAAAGRNGYYLELEIEPAQQSALDRIGDRRQGVELVAVREPIAEQGRVAATVFVPETAARYFLDKVEQYRSQETKTGKPKNQELVARVETARLASVRSLFTDDVAPYPAASQTVWWEVWTRVGGGQLFREVAARLGVQVKPHTVRFPEREVLLALANEATLERIVENSDLIMELRVAKDSPAMFLELGSADQYAWAEDLAGRVDALQNCSVVVCILDSGITREHPLIAPALAIQDMHAYDPSWGPADDGHPSWRGHGTAMAGIALYGDLVDPLSTPERVDLVHCLESVKVLPPAGSAPNDPDLYGAITQEAVARAAVAAPNRQRVVCLAVTSIAPSTGRPSSWSAELDQLCFANSHAQVVTVAAGNVDTAVSRGDYPARNDLEAIKDPGQAWNALTVGAYTEKVNLSGAQYAGWTAIAPAGRIAPTSCTSIAWNRRWVAKPDIVMEGGNFAANGDAPEDADAADELRLLTTHYQPVARLFGSFGDTSAATAQAARLAAQVIAARPDLEPETVRALLVHSADWTPAMWTQFQSDVVGGRQLALQALLRRYGYGVPDLGRALLSAANDVTLIIEDSLVPFEKWESRTRTKEMHIHQLPWPTQVLQTLGATTVEMRITLSYFVEPNPSERGWGVRHRYASHGLRFALKRATETMDEFRGRVNVAARNEEEGNLPASSSGSDEFLLGQLRDRGSIHSDHWRGNAADLAGRDAVGVYPVGGWWKEKPQLNRWDESARYSLIVSIRAPEAAVDIYSPIATTITASVGITT